MERFRYLPKAKLLTLPKAPGVYALSSPKAILYIGKADNIKDRVKNHFTQTNYKDNLFIKDVTRVGYIKTDSDIDALLLESKLIKTKQPKYNVMWKDDKKYFYVAITKEKLPRIFLTHQPFVASAPQGLRPLNKKGEGAERSEVRMQYIGPFIEGKAIKRVLRLLRRIFPYYTAKRHGALLCQYCHLNLCPGPPPRPEGADEAHSQSERNSFEKAYKKNIQNLVSVLKGKKISVLKQLKRDMKNAARNQDFEKASAFKDQSLSLERIISHARLLSPKVSPSLNWNMIEKELQKLFLTKKRITRIEAYDISNIQGTEATGSQVTFLKGVPAKEYYRKYKIHITGKPNDFAMMKELLERRLKHPEWPYPQIMVIDGGKGQLTAALGAISNLISLSYSHSTSLRQSPGRQAQFDRNKLQNIRVVALAKKQSELFFPEKPRSVLLRDLPRPLENLFLHIRDEAHRFAISYHHTLRSKTLLTS
ncbi:GIY-YIG nuclease family protein [Patescibacteria group bacterium]|nr:GIY-YIG nuclease family protein [Patescibacteria group bacterium]